MKRLIPLALLAVAGVAQAEIVITEIHYNPNGSEGAQQEWIEIYNTGPSMVDLSGWEWGDSQDDQWAGKLADGITLEAGKAAILTAHAPEVFHSIWGMDIHVIQCAVGISLGNSATATNETVALRDKDGATVDEVNYETNLNGWPAHNNRSTIYLKPDFISTAGNDLGSNWGLSTLDVDGAHEALILHPELANATLKDLGSPGTVAIPEPGTVGALCLVAGMLGLSRRRRPQ